jgi:4-hydroxybenzoate polyprenyltransferase
VIRPNRNRLISLTLALLAATHFIPSVAVTLFACLFAIGLGVSGGDLVLIAAAVLMQQFSVGLSNDWLDYERDSLTNRSDKPVVVKRVSIALVRNASIVSAAIAAVLAGFLGIAAGLWMLGMLAAGWAYNLGLKASVLSVIPYAVGFGILPSFVSLALSEPRLAPWWVSLVAALLGVAAHFANALPDLLDDHVTGVVSLPHRLGRKLSALAISVTAISATALIISQSPELPAAAGWIGFIVTLCLAFVASLLSLKAKPPRIIFPLLILAALVNVILLTLSLMLPNQT